MLLTSLLLVGSPSPASAQSVTDDALTDIGPVGPIDRGGDPATTANGATIQVTRDAHETGAWSSVAPWPLGALHAIVLPNGKVLTYGITDGRPSYGFNYDVWDPTRGLGAGSHTTLPVQTKTNLFCSAQTVLSSGDVLITGGEENGAPGGAFNDGVNDVNLFDPVGNSLTRLGDAMSYARWYPTATTLPNGEVLVHGGRDETGSSTLVPEIYSQVNGWRRLPGAASEGVYGSGRWWYPRSWVAPDGNVFIVTKDDRGMWSFDPRGRGRATRLGTYPGPSTDNRTPAAMFDVGKILLTQRNGAASVVDITGATPKVTRTQSLDSYRAWSDATVLADGQVLVSGGASRNQQLEYATNQVEIWNPETGRWRTGPAASKARLYHSTSILLPDGSVLTAGGGPPGPVTNLNAEIYYPPYLFAQDGSGQLAQRPRIMSVGEVGYGTALPVRVADAGRVSKIAMIRTGSVTHSFDMDQRFMELDFTQSGDQLTVRGPRNANVAPPGRYLLFVFDEHGVPSVAEILQLAPAEQPVSDGVQTGSVTLPQGTTARWIPVTFARPFDRTPVVSAGAVSQHGRAPVTARIRNVTPTGFELELDTWRHLRTRHTFETVSFIAAEPGRHQIGDATLEAGAVTADGRWRQARFAAGLGRTPIVLAQIASDFDRRGAAVRVRRVGAGGFQLRLQGNEADERRGRRHGQETVHYLALTPGYGRIDGRKVWVGVTSVSVTNRWKGVRFGRSLATPRIVAADQTAKGFDPVVLRYDAVTSRTARLRLQEERSHDREVRHGRERVGYVAIGAR
ncbi:MAG: DUF1929 domain-containing protein [Actinobacteria bacterium]|nr:DUF1929 domain-containing protein [Actinomycetota bacterium]